MSSLTVLRLASRTQPQSFVRPSGSLNQSGSLSLLGPRCRSARSQPLTAVTVTPAFGGCSQFSSSAGRRADKDGQEASDNHEESFEEFTARFEKEFEGVQDVFELQRNLNNAFAYDLVPSPSVITAALRAARRVNDYPTAVRVFEGVKAKVENKGQYDEYLKELKPLREELGVDLQEELYPDPRYSGSATV